MRRVYEITGYLVALLVVVQAAMIAWGVSGLFGWITAGGVLDKATLEDRGELHFTEEIGFAVHGLNGTFVIPVVALALLLLSFFTRTRGASVFAGIVVLLVLVQQQLGFLGSALPAAGAAHGTNALLLFTTALVTALRMRRIRRADVVASDVQTQTPAPVEDRA